MRSTRSLELQRGIKRALDLVVAALLLVLLSPVMLAVALALVVFDPGPVIFRQLRAGQGGRPFTILKFRTMREPREPADVGPSETRITPIGRLLRRTSLDELPQLVNVLRGEMSLVGPRPDLPHHAAAYSDPQRRRLEVRPGITGWAQIHGRNELSWPERIELDLQYLEGWSLARDLHVLRRTFVLVLSGRGTPLATRR